MLNAAAKPLNESEVDAAVRILVRSFANDPGFHFVLPDPADREQLGAPLARAAVRYTLSCGSPLVTTEDVRGVALWFSPDAAPPTASELVKSGVAAVPAQLGEPAWQRFKRLLDHLDALHPRYAPDPHWYLAMLGVDPTWQRQGLGEALMRPVIALADQGGHCCYLEAPTEENARYYERRGFQTIAETDVPETDVHIWLMRREPAEQR